MKRTVYQSKLSSGTKTPKPSRVTLSESGFTIIETLIVLAIAGLILLIVFWAIPAVERSSRNGQRKHDVVVILDAVARYELKDSGNFPLPCGPGAPFCNSNKMDMNNPNDYFMYFPRQELVYYNQHDSIELTPETSNQPVAPSGQSIGPNMNSELVKVFDFEKCDQNNDGGASSVGADYSNVVALYAIENSNGAKSGQCQEL
jgi:prepilin-type N-terminal cleavage/methylation domain-containing protein